MAAGEGSLSTVWKSLAFLRPEKVRSSLLVNPDDVSDACSDSASDVDENSRHVVQWLQSLPVDNQWCEAEEQIGRSDSSEALVDGISSIGDSDAPIILKSHARPRAESSAVKKPPKDKKYRRGALHAKSSPKKTPKTGKKIVSTSAKGGAESKSTKFTTPKAVSEVNDESEKRNEDSTNIKCRPAFDNPEFGKMLDDAMNAAINKYKRNERSWETPNSGKVTDGTHEPPAKRSRAPSFRFIGYFH